MADWLGTWFQMTLSQPTWVLVLLMIGAALISEDVTLGLSLAAASMGKLSYGFVFWANFLAITIGDLTIYGAGYYFRKRVQKWAWLADRVSAERLQIGYRLYERFGSWIVMITRVLPGSRSTAYLVAGIVRAPILPFVATSLISVAVWLYLIVWVAKQLTTSQLVAVFVAVMASLILLQRWLLLRLRAAKSRR